MRTQNLRTAKLKTASLRTPKRSDAGVNSGALFKAVRAKAPLGAVLGAILCSVGLTGCESAPSLSSVTSMFEAEKAKLPGKRVSVVNTDSTQSLAGVEAKEPIHLPPTQNNASWSQPGGSASNAPGHLYLTGAKQTAWQAEAGEGSSKKGRLTAVPIVENGKIYTLDTEGNVSAFAAASGSRIWRVSLTPAQEKEAKGFGGGLAAEGGRIFAATGYGTVVALDASSGKQLWSKFLGVPIRTSPTAYAGKVFVVNTESQLFALSADNGAELWTGRGLPETASLLSNVSPAVSGNMAVVAYPSGDVVAFDIKTGQQRWSEQLSGAAGMSLNKIGDAARPAIDRDIVYAVSRSGKMVATSITKGERLWAREVSANQTPCPAGEVVFVVDLRGKLLALGRKDGKVHWMTGLPDGQQWNGPVLASGQLWLASSTGQVISVDAQTGVIGAKTNLDTPIFIAPIVAGGKMYVFSDKARLIAMN
jgi:outer membrane protein assembly factor BamB